MATVRRRKARRNAKITTTQYGRKRKKKNRDKIHIGEKCIRDRWDKQKTLRQNLSAMGLAIDPNTAIPIVPPKSSEEVTLATVESAKGSSSDLLSELEAMSQQTTVKKKFCHISLSEAKVLVRLIHTHDTSYKRMARDKRNILQLTEAQLRRKCMDLHRSSFSYLLEDEDPDVGGEKDKVGKAE